MKRPLLLVSLFCLAVAVGCERFPNDPAPLYANLQVGDELQLNVQSDSACTLPDYRSGRVVAITERAVVVEDVNNPAGGFTPEEYRSIGITFDTLVYPVAATNFGEPVNLNGNGRVLIFYTRAVNELTARNQDSYVGGFFHARDLFPRTDTPRFTRCAGSNYAEMFYMLVPDPEGVVNGNRRSKSMVLNTTIGVLGHEFQHLINAARRLHVLRLSRNWNEEVWLNEGLSHIAEELIGHRMAGLTPGRNIGWVELNNEPARSAFTQFYSANFTRLQVYLSEPETETAIGQDNLATRGATWQFLRYAADRRGGAQDRLWRNLVNTEAAGMANLRAALGVEPLEWMQDWVISIYTDDEVARVAQIYQQRSWNFRSIYPAMRDSRGQPLGGYPLKTVTLENGRTTSLTIRAASGAFLRFGVAPGARAEIRLNGTATSCQSNGPALSLQVGDVHKVEGSAAGAICLEGGTAGAEFTYVPFSGSEVPQDQLVLSVTSTGIIPVLSPSSVPPADLGVLAAVPQEQLRLDRDWERRLREREIVQLSPHVGDAGAPRLEGPSFSVSTTSAAGTVEPRLRVAIVRTR